MSSEILALPKPVYTFRDRERIAGPNVRFFIFFYQFAHSKFVQHKLANKMSASSRLEHSYTFSAHRFSKTSKKSLWEEKLSCPLVFIAKMFLLVRLFMFKILLFVYLQYIFSLFLFAFMFNFLYLFIFIFFI